MRPLTRCLLMALACLPAAAQAGDPCPIDFTFHDAGAPPWLDHAALLDGLATKDSWLGMSYKTHKDKDGTEMGVRVTNVSAGSPTQKAGLKVDDVITRVAGAPMVTYQALNAVMDASKPGAVLALTVMRAGTKMQMPLTLSRQDPLFGALVRYASTQECASVSRGDTPAAWLTKISPHLYAKNKRFRCDDAAKALAKDLEPGQIVLIRGSKRVLIANPGSTTVCVQSANYDGAKLTPASVKALYERLTKSYVADRHANP